MDVARGSMHLLNHTDFPYVHIISEIRVLSWDRAFICFAVSHQFIYWRSLVWTGFAAVCHFISSQINFWVMCHFSSACFMSLSHATRNIILEKSFKKRNHGTECGSILYPTFYNTMGGFYSIYSGEIIVCRN